MNTWVDYSQGVPSGAGLAAAGITGAIRYVGLGSSGKRLTQPELDDLRAHGITVLGVAESTTTEANNGYAAGQADAQTALADPVSTTLPVLFAANDQSTYTQADVDYVRGFRDVVGLARTGAYGFGDFLTACRDQGVASTFWQAGHPPNMTNTPWVHFWQRQGTSGDGTSGPASPTTQTIDGVVCDLDNQLNALIGALVTTLDDTFQSTYVNEAGVRSTVTLSYAQALANSDGGQYTIRQLIAGELRALYPDNQQRNIVDALKDITGRLIQLESQVATVVTAVAALAAAQTSDTANLQTSIGAVSTAVAALPHTHATGTATVTVNLTEGP